MINLKLFKMLGDTLDKIEYSFKNSIKGQEDLKILIRWWGILAYAIFYLIINKIIVLNDIRFIDIILSSIGIIYFSWHIFALIKCSPKKPKLSKEEKARLRSEAWHNLPKSFMRKLLLKESFTKWNPVRMTIVVDLLFITHFLGYLLK